MLRRLVVVGVALVGPACGGSSESADPPTTENSVGSTTLVEPTTSTRAAANEPIEAPTTTEGSATSVVTTSTSEPAPAPEAWRAVPGGPECACSDGSPLEFWDRPADPTKVMLYFEGGGACFSAETCGPDSQTFTRNVTLGEPPAGRGGLFDAANPENPLAEHSIVYVPYCTGDVHLGNATTEYSPEVTIRHNGYVNGTTALDYLVATYPDVEQLVVAGASAGSVPTPLFAGLASDLLPGADILTFGDSSGAYPDVPAVNAAIGGLWGTAEAVPDWPVNEGLTAEDWSFPDIYVQAGRHAPQLRFARFDYAFDGVQASFGALAGIGADDLVTLIDQTEEQIETAGVSLASYVAPGTEHTIMGGDEFYEMEVEGVRLVDWVREHVEGGQPADVRCVECDPPAPSS